MKQLAPLLVALLAQPFAACGDDGGHHGSCGLEANCVGLSDYQAGMVVMGTGAVLGVRVISVDPAPPDVGSVFTVEVVDAQGAAVATGAIASANAWSIDCGHFGTQGGAGVAVTDNGDGSFTFTPDYGHGGPWNVELSVGDGTATDEVAVGFCLPEDDGGHTH